MCVLYHPQLNLLEFENCISGVVLYLHITERPHLLMSGRDWIVLGMPQPQLPEAENSPEALSKTAAYSFVVRLEVSLPSVPEARFQVFSQKNFSYGK